MKKITLLWALLLTNFVMFAQTNPCPDIQSHGFTPITTSGTNCTSKVFVYATGDVSAQKGLQITVYAGAVTPGNQVAQVCHIVPASSPSTYYETPSFTVACNVSITYVISKRTSSNGLCGGGECGTSVTVNGGPLPIKLGAFYAKRNSSSVELSWKTESEINAKTFVVQRKKGNDFIDITSIDATNKSTGSSYSYSDKNISSAISQYRLKMIDADGSFNYSEIRIVKGSFGSVSDFTIFPNPSAGNTRVAITDIAEDTDVQLLDHSGRVLKIVSMNNKTTVDFNSLQNGMYMIRIINKASGEALTKKLNVVN